MITPVLLCGGSGTRLWPLSRRGYPKQFSSILGKETLFQSTARRLSGKSFEAPVVVTANAFRFIATEQLSSIGVVPSAVLIEPSSKDSAPAVLAAALDLQQTAPDTLMLIAPCDHNIPDGDLFRAILENSLPAARSGKIVTFGIKPDRPETGYGYLELNAEDVGQGGCISLKRFVEKPDQETATSMVGSGRYLWNAGIFLASVETVLKAFEMHAPTMIPTVKDALLDAQPDLSFTRLDKEHWAELEPISLDFAVMEKAQNLCVAPFDGEWTDLGDWASVWRETQEAGLALSDQATAVDCATTLLRTEVEGQVIVGIGLENIVAVAMPDAVLVAHKDRTQDVKQAVDVLKSKRAKQAEDFPKDHRPWGWFESIASGDRFQVKRIVVHPGASLSLQSHHHRAEHWIVVEGTAKVTVDETVKLVSENESVYVPLGATHRLENPGKLPMILIEVQTGSYLGEDDIIRYEDNYARD